LVLIGKNKIKI